MKGIRTVLTRLGERLRGDAGPVLGIDDPGLRVVVEAFDQAEAASAALERSELWHAPSPAVLRHHLLLPEHELAASREMLEHDGWAVRPGGRGEQDTEDHSRHDDLDLLAVVALRVQQLDALHCSQESARMAGLAQRRRGHALGWDALQPDSDNH